MMSQLANQQPAALQVMGPLIILLGRVTFLGSIFDPAKTFTKMYEFGKDRRTGISTISVGPRSFRFWSGLLGLFALAVGVAMVVIAF
jgi:hypothetical protein